MEGAKYVERLLNQQEDARDYVALLEMNGGAYATKQWRILSRYKPGPDSINLRRQPAEKRGGRWIARQRQESVTARSRKRNDFGLFRKRLGKALLRCASGSKKRT